MGHEIIKHINSFRIYLKLTNLQEMEEMQAQKSHKEQDKLLLSTSHFLTNLRDVLFLSEYYLKYFFAKRGNSRRVVETGHLNTKI